MQPNSVENALNYSLDRFLYFLPPEIINEKRCDSVNVQFKWKLIKVTHQYIKILRP